MISRLSRSPMLLLALALLGACGRQAPAGLNPASPLFSPTGPEMTRTAPPIYTAVFETTAGEFEIEVNRDWSPNGADRFYNLVRHGFYDGSYFFRVLPGFIAQFGVPVAPVLSLTWREHRIPDDPLQLSNERGTVSFAMSGPNSRTTQIFVNLADNPRLDAAGFTPFGRVVRGMEVFDQLYSGYGEGPPQGTGPDQIRLQEEGRAYVEREFPRLDAITRARIGAP